MLISGPSTSSGTDIDSTPKHRLVDSPISRLVNQITEFQCKPSAETNLFGYAKAQPEIMKSEALNNHQQKNDTSRKRPQIRRPYR